MFPSSRVLCVKTVFSGLLLQLFPNSKLLQSLLWCFPQRFGRKSPQIEEYFTSWAKCEVPELWKNADAVSAFHLGWHVSLNVRPFPTPNRLRKLKKFQDFPLGFVPFFFLCVFSPQYLFVLSSFLLFLTLLHLLLHTSIMSFFIFCTYRPFSLLNSPPSPLLWLSLSLSGA